MSTKTITPEQFKQNLRAQGKTIVQWAAEHGFKTQEVYFVLSGVRKGTHGRSHDIAVALGIKAPYQPSQAA